LVQAWRGGDDDNVSALLNRALEGSRGDAAAGHARRGWLSGPDLITLAGAEVGVRDDAVSLHVAALDAAVPRSGDSTLLLKDASCELTGGASAGAERVLLHYQSTGRFLPAGWPDIEVAGGAMAPWKRLALTGIVGTIKGDPKRPTRAVIALAGGY